MKGRTSNRSRTKSIRLSIR